MNMGDCLFIRFILTRALYNHLQCVILKKREYILQGRVKFPTGGKVRERSGAELVHFQYRQYSLDERR
jgi:hypothetical protein